MAAHLPAYDSLVDGQPFCERCGERNLNSNVTVSAFHPELGCGIAQSEPAHQYPQHWNLLCFHQYRKGKFYYVVNFNLFLSRHHRGQ